MTSRSVASCLGLAVALAGSPGCGKRKVEPIPTGSLVITQVPAPAGAAVTGSLPDGRYPDGSRVVLAKVPLDPKSVTVLSEGLLAAGEPVVSPDSGRVLFSGKGRDGRWQVYEVTAAGGPPRALTAVEGGATSPALLADGSVVFASPVPRSKDAGPGPPVALWALSASDKGPRRLTFGTDSATDPTVLSDGRILFASAQPGASPGRTALFTIYNDGTGVSPYACQHDGGGDVGRPREISGGRVAFLSRQEKAAGEEGQPEAVVAARPWRSRALLLPRGAGRCTSVEPGEGGSLLLAMQTTGAAGQGPRGIREVLEGPSGTDRLLFHDPAWNEVEAIRVEPRKRPMGRISTINPAKKTGVVFSIDVNHTTYEPATPAVRIRILTAGDGGARPLGEVPVHADGSFLAEVPSDVPLGFEALDRDGKVVRRLPPSVWVRPGENRGCIGCHEPHGLAPRNRRPLAVKGPAVAVGLAPNETYRGSAR